MKFLDKQVFNFILNMVILYGPEILSDNNYPLLGIILSTFPLGILSLMSLKNKSSLDVLITQTITSNIIIIITWFGIYLNSETTDFKFLSLSGILIWAIISVIYYIYLSYNKN